jgi:hypothetical protein
MNFKSKAMLIFIVLYLILNPSFIYHYIESNGICIKKMTVQIGIFNENIELIKLVLGIYCSMYCISGSKRKLKVINIIR